MIDGFRYSFIGQSDGSIKFGIVFLFNLLLLFIFLIYYIKKVIKLNLNNEFFSKKL